MRSGGVGCLTNLAGDAEIDADGVRMTYGDSASSVRRTRTADSVCPSRSLTEVDSWTTVRLDRHLKVEHVSSVQPVLGATRPRCNPVQTWLATSTVSSDVPCGSRGDTGSGSRLIRTRRVSMVHRSACVEPQLRPLPGCSGTHSQLSGVARVILSASSTYRQSMLASRICSTVRQRTASSDGLPTTTHKAFARDTATFSRLRE